MLWATGYNDVAADDDSSTSTAITSRNTSIADSVGNTVLAGYVPPPSPPPPPPPHTFIDDNDGGTIGMPRVVQPYRRRQGRLPTIREV